jgi:hypothetical protein
MSFDPATLTREFVIATALSYPFFREELDELKSATGFGPDSIDIKDHIIHSTYKVDNVVLVVRFNADGSPAPVCRVSVPAWITSGSHTHTHDKWGYARSKNPLYIGTDGAIHISTESRGFTLYLHNEDENFKTVADKNRGVYFQGNLCNPTMTVGTYEAHVCLTVAELAALT